MDDYQQNEDEPETVEGESIKQKEVPDEASGRRPSLKDISDGRRLSSSERRDSETISEAEEEYLRKMLSERRGSFRPQPKQTVAYQVQPTDTLEGIAIRYNITPSELTVLNKLNSRVVFPGQTIYIPEKNSLQALEDILKQSAAAIVTSSSSSSEQNSPKPGHVERVADSSEKIPEKTPEISEKYTSDISVSEFALKEKVSDGTKESLRINSKYVTDGEGVVGGILIVTTNHIIFDPNVSDPLVIEYGLEKYGVEAPMNCIVRAALYTDIFRMKIKDANVSDGNVDVYHSKNLSMKKSKSNIEKLGGKMEKVKPLRRYSAAEVGNKRADFSMPFSSSFQENLSKICEAADPDENEEENETDSSKPPSPPNDEGTSPLSDSVANLSEVDGSKHPAVKAVLSNSSSFDSEEGYVSRKASMSDDDTAILAPESGSPKKKSNFEKTKHKLHKGLKKFSLTDGLFSAPHGSRRMSLPAFTSLPDFKHKNSSVKSPVSGEKAAEKPKSGNAIYVNMVDEKPELFAPLDKLIPRPAKSFCDTPLYLCLRMGQPIAKSSTHTSVIHFGHKMKPEYWFSIPKDSVDDLYFFFLRWCPDKYGDIDKIDLEALGYLPIEPESHEEPEEKVLNPNHRRASWAFPWRRKSKDVTEISSTSSPEDWEFLDYLGAKTESVHPPELLTPSKILNDEQLLEINKHLPARAMNPWELIYGSYLHGFSLKTMYRSMAKYDCPVLLVIVNRNDAIFGAYLSSTLRLSDHFYGTGESFLFTFHPEFKIYQWSGENDYFIKGNVDSFFVGSSEGHFGLWLDDDLFHGRTNACQTFANEPLCPEEDFEVKSLEAWGFV
ncbi:oxidation resistance protein 1-like isoform X1 [Argiope bruennichi]|uniref:oxidation resistance protein 1-like isoform X1 n=1 Tax=Argiope bruennichi TaxID=94029 RepID=UPI0024940F01|nr:oxidation resistance protein 1-like isoform X1 [Argiope bruennichi]